VEATYSGFAEVSFSIYKWTYADPDWDYLTRYLASGSGAGAP
jgi:hypothetical protein